MLDPLLDTFSLEFHVRERQEEALRQAARQRLLAALKRSQHRRPSFEARLKQWVGSQLIRWGYLLLPLPQPAADGERQLPVMRPAARLTMPRPRASARGRCRQPSPKPPPGHCLASEW
jgi:hypothetical protein